jgi:hypothetical protein
LCSKDLTSFIGSPTHVYTPTDQIFLNDLLMEVPLNIFL